jgi:hypothetical protein
MGIMDEVFLGLTLSLLFPMGICIFEAYFYKLSIEPIFVSIFCVSGLRAFPLYPLIVLEVIPFLTAPA